jgi:hypothetical protein
MSKYNVKYRKPINNQLSILLKRLFGIELLTSYKLGWFHQVGYSGKQKNNNYDIAIIEEVDGCLITIPNDKKYYTKLCIKQ